MTINLPPKRPRHDARPQSPHTAHAYAAQPLPVKTRRRHAEREAVLARRRHEHDEQNRVAIRNGLLWLGALVVLASTAGALWLRENARAEAEQKARLERREALRAELLVAGTLTPEHAQTLLRRLDATRAEWQNGPDAPAFLMQAEQARTVVAEAAVNAAVARDLEAVQRGFETAGTNADVWQQLRARATALLGRLPPGPSPLRAQAEGAADRADAGWFDAAFAAGKAAGATRAALALLAGASDLAEDKVGATQRRPAVHAQWRERSKQVVPVRDAVEKAVFDAAAIAAVAWQDLRHPEADWVTSRAGNVTRKVHGNGIAVACAGGERAASGIVVLRNDAWHAAALAFDVQLDRGTAVVFARTTSQFAEKTGGGLRLTTGAVDRADTVAVPAGQRVHVEMTVVGDQVVAVVGERRVELRIGHDERRGAFGVLVQPDTAVAFRDLRVRRLH